MEDEEEEEDEDDYDYEEELELKLENGKIVENIEEEEVIITLPAKIEEVTTEEEYETETESTTTETSSSSEFQPSVNIVEVTDIKECEGLQTVTECSVSEADDDDNDNEYQVELEEEEADLDEQKDIVAPIQEAVDQVQVEEQIDNDLNDDNWLTNDIEKEDLKGVQQENSEQQHHIPAAEFEEEGQESICRKGSSCDNNQTDNEPNIEGAVMEAGISETNIDQDAVEVANMSEKQNNSDVKDNKPSESDIRNEMLRRMPTPKIPSFVKTEPPCSFQDNPTCWIEWLEVEVLKFKEEQLRKKEEQKALEESKQILELQKEQQQQENITVDESTPQEVVNESVEIEDIKEQKEVIVKEELDLVEESNEYINNESAEIEESVAEEKEEETEADNNNDQQDLKLDESEKVKNDSDNKIEIPEQQQTDENENENEEDWEWESGSEEEEEGEEKETTLDNTTKEEVAKLDDSEQKANEEPAEECDNVQHESAVAEQLLLESSNEEDASGLNKSDDKKVEQEKGQDENKTQYHQEEINNNEEEKDTFALDETSMTTATEKVPRKHSDPMEVVEKMRQMRQNRLLQRHISADGAPTNGMPPPPAFMRANSNPNGESSRNRSRPSSIVADDNLDEMLGRVKKLREERQQILKDMAMLRDATSDETTLKPINTDNNDIDNQDHNENRGRLGSFDSGIGPSKSVTTEGSVVETRKVSHKSNEDSDIIYCFICDEELGKLNKQAVIHMGLEDGEPICPEALNLTEKSKQKIRNIALTTHLDLKTKYEFLETLDLDLLTGEDYDFTVEDALQKVENFLDDIEEQKQKDQQQFDLIRDGLIDEIFAAEFATDDEEPKVDTSDYAEDIDEISEASASINAFASPIPVAPPMAPHAAPVPPVPPAPPPAPPPIPPPMKSADPHLKEARSELLNAIKSGVPKLKSSVINDKSEPEQAGKVLHRHLAPRVFTREVRDLMKEIQKPKHKLKKTKTNDRSKPYIPEDIEIYFYAGPNADKNLAPPPLSREIPNKRTPSPIPHQDW